LPDKEKKITFVKPKGKGKRKGKKVANKVFPIEKKRRYWALANSERGKKRLSGGWGKKSRRIDFYKTAIGGGGPFFSSRDGKTQKRSKEKVGRNNRLTP